MSNLVYLISSLPSLSFGRPTTITMAEFMGDAETQLSESEYKTLKIFDIQNLDKARKTTYLSSIIELYNNILTDKLEIRKARNAESNPTILSLSKNITDNNPLELEKYIMELFWDELTAIESTENFTLTEVIAYKLKLQIAERLNSFNVEKGKQILEKVVNPLQNDE